MAQMMSFYKRKTDEPYDYSDAKSTMTTKSSPVSQYNPASSNYWAKTPAKTAPTTSGYDYSTAKSVMPVKKVTTPTTQPSTSDQLLQKLSQIAKDRAAVEEKRALQQTQRLTERQNAAAAMLPTQQATLEKAKEKAIGNIKSGITSQEDQTAADKQAIEEIYGAQQREAMQAQREEQGNLQNLFAGLGTVDSSVFQNQAANSAARLTGKTQSIGAQKTRDLVAANRALSEYKTTAQQLIDKEQENFDKAIQSIQLTYAQGTQEYNDAIIGAWNTAQDNIYKIENDVTEKELAFEQEKAKLELVNGSKSGKMTDKQALAKTGYDTIGQLKSYINQNQNIMKDINPLSNRDYKTLIINVTDLIGRMRSGGAINIDEEKRFKSMLPSFWDNPQNAQFKLDQLSTEFANILQQPDYTQGYQTMSIPSDTSGGLTDEQIMMLLALK